MSSSTSNRPHNHAERAWEVIRHNWDLGFTSFGGPPTHFQILHRRFVENLRLIDEPMYQELFALTQALPGPASTKMVYCIALHRAGFLGAVLAFLLWSLPGALGMFGLALGIASVGETLPPLAYALLSGLNASTVGIVAVAAFQLSERTITDPLSRTLIAFTAGAGMLYRALWYFPVLMAISGLTTVIWDVGGGQGLARQVATGWQRVKAAFLSRPGSGPRVEETTAVAGDVEMERVRSRAEPDPKPAGAESIVYDPPTLPAPSHHRRVPLSSRQSIAPSTPPLTPPPLDHALQTDVNTTAPSRVLSIKTGLAIIVGFFTSFITLLVLRGSLAWPPLGLKVFTNFYLAGTIIFGGGPVVIPLLREYTVAEGWVTSRDFLLGLAVIQSFPGPNFNFAVYLATLAGKSAAGSHSLSPALGAVLGYVGIFLPGLALATATTSLFPLVRKYKFVASVLRGLNAGGVGLIWTAVYRLWEIGYLTPGISSGVSLGLEPWWVVVALVAFSGNRWYGVPAPVSIIFGGVLGMIWWAVAGKRN